MSLVFSNTTTKHGIIQEIEKNCGYNDGDITSNATRLARVTGDVNSAMDSLLTLLFRDGSGWQYDDSNQTDYPEITTNVVSGQRDYSFTTDGSGNVILDVYKVFIKNTAGVYHEIFPVNVRDNAQESFTDGQGVTGQPTSYTKTGNGIILNVPADYNSTAGLKVMVSRENTYFTTSDTTKKPGFDGRVHYYLVAHATYAHFARPQNRNESTVLWRDELAKWEQKVKECYAVREKDVAPVMTVAYFNAR